MIRVSIVSLIYQSATLADWVHDSVFRFTPMLARGEAEFFFVANDPHPALLNHLQTRGYQYVVNINTRYTEKELFELGYAGPEHMSRVYRGYNEGVRKSRGDVVVLVNSDNFFSPDWLENLLKYSDRSMVISSTLVERNHPEFMVFPGALHGEFGATPATFDESGFLAFASRTKRTGLERGGAFMPSLFHRDVAIQAGLYPCGNIAGSTYEDVAKFGDEAFFETLSGLGVSHFTSMDSISYHLKEGERADAPPGAGEESDVAAGRLNSVHETPAHRYPVPVAVTAVRDPMPPIQRHEAIISALVVPSGEAPSTRTMRQLVASGTLNQEKHQAFADEIARRDMEYQMQQQAVAVRNVVRRVFGARLEHPVMRLIRRISSVAGPVRRAIARRRLTRRPN
jgi:hypothetical protein